MRKIIVLFLAVVCIFSAKAQHTMKVLIKDMENKEPLSGTVIKLNNSTVITGKTGFAEFMNIPDGWHVLTCTHTGYTSARDSFSFPLAGTDTIIMYMQHEEEELEEVIIQSTRTSRTIRNTPTRVETIDGEELDEKNNMRPGNVSMLLHESTGLQVQQTSATTGNASIRVQGLDGRYTQLLKDGYPNFGNFASGLSVLEIPPLDLKQVEVIKGPASTLYGGGAIAGVVNFISKQPGDEFHGDFILNQSNIGQTNIGAYISQKKNKLGYSLLGTFNQQRAFDVDKDHFSEVPKGENFTINPRLFYYIDSSTSIMLGNSFTKGTSRGGDMDVINGKPNAEHTYFEKNSTTRNTTTFEVDKKLSAKAAIKLKQSVSIFDRQISIPGYDFSGLSTYTFSDLSLTINNPRHTLVTGLNFMYDRFRQKLTNTQNTRSYTTGAYVQSTLDLSAGVKVEGGLRIDHVAFRNQYFSQNKAFILPRVSAMFTLSDKLTSRIGFGLGYKIPTIFNEQTESMHYRDIQPLIDVKAEKSVGGTADINFKTKISEALSFSVNQMFFYTGISSPLVLQSGASGSYFINASKPVISSGFETNVKFIHREGVKLFIGYTMTNAKATYLPVRRDLPLMPGNKLNLTLMYEKEDNFKFGLESYFTDRQYLFDGSRTPSFWEFGFMAQKTFNKLSFFVNFENFTDQRQSKYKTVANPPHDNPTFDEIWNHTEGFVINGGIKLQFK